MGAEEFCQQRRTLVCENAGSHFRPVIEHRMAQEITNRSRHPSLVVPRAKNYAPESRQNYGAGAHGAGFERYVKGTVIQPPVVELRGCFADREYFGVRRGILIASGAIGRSRKDRAAMHDDGANRNFVSLPRLSREIEGVSNVLFVFGEKRMGGAKGFGRGSAICWQAPALSLF
jgi:hypothetical protein